MITLDQAKDALLRSGYLLESRVEAVLRRKGYLAWANSVYPDPITGKSRELDVSGITATTAGPGRFDFLFTQLLIECVNNPEPLVLITKSPTLGFLHHHEVQVSGIPVKVPAKGAGRQWLRLTDYLGLEKYHHYCRGRVATQYCSFQKKKQPAHDWMAWHDEAHFDAFSKLSAAVDHSVAEHYRKWLFKGSEPLNLQLYYPVVVVQGELIEARPSRIDVRLFRRSHMALRRSEYVGGQEKTYQIDVVQERHLPRLLAVIESESDRMAALLRRRHRAIRIAIDRIVRMARRFKSPERIRAAMEL
jgi:hypothetical protein